MKNISIKCAVLLSALSLVALAGCGGTGPEASSEVSIVDPSGFKNVNDKEPFELHSDLQKAFLEYDGSFAT